MNIVSVTYVHIAEVCLASRGVRGYCTALQHVYSAPPLENKVSRDTTSALVSSSLSVDDWPQTGAYEIGMKEDNLRCLSLQSS